MRVQGKGPNAAILVAVARAARGAGAAAYLVGGAVRDLLLSRDPVDLDVALEGPAGSAEAAVAALSSEPGWRGRARHESFGTATLEAPSGRRVDLAVTREERYPHPGSLPVVSPGVSIGSDLARRDFTIHAMAVPLGPRGIDGPLIDHEAKGHRVELVGTEALAGGPAHHLRVTLKSGAVRHVWVDAATGLVVRTVATRTVRRREVAIETTFGDFRETGGVTFARSIETSVRERPQRLRIVVESVEVNPALDEARFRMPR